MYLERSRLGEAPTSDSAANARIREGSGSMVIGITRPRSQTDSRSAFSIDQSHRSEISSDWLTNRGAIRYEVSCELFGGFPGFAQQGGFQGSSQLRITDQYLLVDEGKASGFGLPISWLEGAVILPFQHREEPGLRVFYRDGACPRVFTIRFRGGRLSMRAHRRAEHALNLLTSLGMNDRYAVSAPAEPSFRVPWNQTRQYETENVVWTGATTAPLQVGLDSTPADVWLTTKSLIWGSPGGDGINRVPLQLLQDVITAQVDDRQKTPAVYISFGDESTGRYDLAFLFDRYDAERNLRERGAFLVGLRSRGVPLGAPVPPYQPWRITNHPVVSQPSLPQDTDEMPTMERPLRRRRRTSISRMVSRHVNHVDEPEWAESLVEEEEDGDFEYFGVADPVWPEPYSAAPFLRIVDESYAEPIANEFEPESPRWEQSLDEAERWDYEPQSPIAPAAIEPEAENQHVAETSPTNGSTRIDTIQFAELMAIELALEQAPEELCSSDVMLAEFADAGQPEILAVGQIALGDYELATGWLIANAKTEELRSPHATSITPTPLLPVKTDTTEAPVEEVTPVDDVAPQSKALTTIQEYEASCLAVLSEVLKAIDDRVACRPAQPISEPLPSPALQASALAALIELTATGEIEMDDARWRKSRMIELGEAGARLRALMELRDFGHISTEDLDHKRESITNHLSTFNRSKP
jgi:hypothetical protein